MQPALLLFICAPLNSIPVKLSIVNCRYFGVECQSYDRSAQFLLDESDSAKYVWKMCVLQHTFYKMHSSQQDGAASNDSNQLNITLEHHNNNANNVVASNNSSTNSSQNQQLSQLEYSDYINYRYTFAYSVPKKMYQVPP